MTLSFMDEESFDPAKDLEDLERLLRGDREEMSEYSGEWQKSRRTRRVHTELDELDEIQQSSVYSDSRPGETSSSKDLIWKIVDFSFLEDDPFLATIQPKANIHDVLGIRESRLECQIPDSECLLADMGRNKRVKMTDGGKPLYATSSWVGSPAKDSNKKKRLSGGNPEFKKNLVFFKTLFCWVCFKLWISAPICHQCLNLSRFLTCLVAHDELLKNARPDDRERG